jgi:hypothetical protein
MKNEDFKKNENNKIIINIYIYRDMVPIWEHYTSQYAKGESINCCMWGHVA